MKQVEEAKDVVAKVYEALDSRVMYRSLIEQPSHLVRDCSVLEVEAAVENPCNDAVWYGVSNLISLSW